MKSIHKIWLIAIRVVMVLLMGSPLAHAGVPTIDVAQLAMQVQQVAAWVQQYEQMVSQITNQIAQLRNLEQALASATGGRQLGAIFNALGVDDLIDPALMDNLKTLNNVAALGAQVKSITDSGQTTIRARAQQIQRLMGAVNATVDAKGVAEVQARIGAETASVANEANMIALLKMQVDAEQDRIQQAIKSRNAANAASAVRSVVDFTLVRLPQ